MKLPIKASDIQSPLPFTSVSNLCLARYNHSNLFQRETDLPLESTLPKPGFPLQNHPKHHWKRPRTEGEVPTKEDELLENRFEERKVPIFLISVTLILSL